MNIKDLKKCIEDKNITQDIIIFNIDKAKSAFIPLQYTNAISNILNMEIKSISDDEIDSLYNPMNALIGWDGLSNCIYLYRTNKFKRQLNDLTKVGKIVIIVESAIDDAKTKEIYGNFIVDVPKLEEWQIKDYVYSNCEGIDDSNLDTLIKLCGNDIFRIHNEVNKINIFNKDERKYLFNDFINDGIFNDLSDSTVFNFSSALFQKKFNVVAEIYPYLSQIDADPMLVTSLLLKEAKKTIDVLMHPNPTTESTGLSEKQMKAIRYYNGSLYTAEQLTSIYEFLLGIDKGLKTGTIPSNPPSVLLDYIICYFICITKEIK